MPYIPDHRHSPQYAELGSFPPLLQSVSLATLKRIPTPAHAPIPTQYAEASLRPGLIVPLTLVPTSSRRIHQHIHCIASVVIAPTPAAPLLSLSLRHDALHGVDSTQSASTFDKDTSTPISDSETITRPSLCAVPQGRYAPLSKSGQTRYGNINQSSLVYVDFTCGPEKVGERMAIAQILEGLSDAYLDGANETILHRHGTNITLHILWPDHAPWTTLVRTKSWKDSSIPITRGELALRLARALKRFTVSAKRDVASVASSTIPVPSSIALGSLYLLSFYQVTQGAWQVGLATVAPTRDA